MTKKTGWIVGILAVCAIVATLVILTHCEKSVVHPNELTQVKIGYLPITVDLPFFVAMELGYFTDEGLEVEPVKFESATNLTDAVLTGRIDATAIGSLTALYGIEVQEPDQFRIYALNANDETFYSDILLVRSGAAIDSVQQLAGRRIGTFPGATIVIATRIVLENFGLMEGDYELIQLSPSLQIQALELGEIDALMALEPTGTIAKISGVGTSLIEAPIEKYLMNPFPGGAAVFSTSWLSENQEVALSIQRATDRAINLIQSNPTLAKGFLPVYTPLSDTIATQTLVCLYWSVQDVDRIAVQEYADLLFEEGVLDQEIETSHFYFEPDLDR